MQETKMEVQKVLHMNAGDDDSSYAKNSSFQRLVSEELKHILKQSIHEFCQSKVGAAEKCIKVADLGCASGPNTLLAIQDIIECMDEEYLHGLNTTIEQLPSVQVFPNDMVSNDFNSIFKLLPGFYEQIEKQGRRPSGSIFVAASPGSFYGRLFPENFIHFVHSSNSLHWLSQVPKGLVTDKGLALNKGSIYVTKTSPASVQDAYLDQFSKDFTKFLRMRSVEMVPDGQLHLTLLSKSDVTRDINYEEMIGIVLNDMVMEGLIEEKTLDNFNLPMYQPSPEEVRNIIENEGSFQIKQLETIEVGRRFAERAKMMKDRTVEEYFARTARAVFENILASQFGFSIMDDLFSRVATKISEYFGTQDSKYILVISLTKKNE